MVLKTNAQDEERQADNSAGVVLRAQSLSKSFGGQDVLRDVDVELRRGEVILLEGENGSGKTTLINILTGNLEPDSGSIHYTANSRAIEFQFPQSWWQRLKPVNRFASDTVARHGFGRTWQDVRLFESMSLCENIAVADPSQRGENPLFAMFSSPFSNGHGAGSEESIQNRSKPLADLAARRTLNQLGLAGREQSSGDMISLGQSKRVAIARAVAAGARVLFLDEPLAGLDRQGINDVLKLLSELVQNRRVTLVIVEHAFNQNHLKEMITSHWRLENGELTVNPPGAAGTTDASTQPHWFQMLADAADEVITEPLPRGAKLTRFRIADRYSSNPVLEITDLVVKRGNRTVVGLDDEGNEAGLNLAINQGEIVILQAPNGWGKSTLFNTLVGLGESDSVNGSARQGMLSGPAWSRRCSGMIAIPSSEALFKTLSASECFVLATEDSFGAANQFENHTISEMSGGQRQLLQLEIALHNSQQDTLVILDEPYVGLDENKSEKFTRKLLAADFQACLMLLPSHFRTIH
ncbi:MAG: ATP-binding cassette domain-containing protein [Planctomycetota bacterium]